MTDDKGHSEETCVRCGWRMGRPPLNCNNDDTPHVFPSQEQRKALEAIATENQAMREALRACLRGDLTLVMDGPTPGIGFDYSYVPATKEVMATLAEVNRLAALAPDTEGEGT